jgi:hypothetical protein
MDRINGKPQQSINQNIIDKKPTPILNINPLNDK